MSLVEGTVEVGVVVGSGMGSAYHRCPYMRLDLYKNLVDT